MNRPAYPAVLRLWTEPPRPGDTPVAGHADWLDAEIADGLADLDAGKAVPLDQLRKELGLE